MRLKKVWWHRGYCRGSRSAVCTERQHTCAFGCPVVSLPLGVQANLGMERGCCHQISEVPKCRVLHTLYWVHDMGQEESSTGRSQGSWVWVLTCDVLNARESLPCACFRCDRKYWGHILSVFLLEKNNIINIVFQLLNTVYKLERNWVVKLK